MTDPTPRRSRTLRAVRARIEKEVPRKHWDDVFNRVKDERQPNRALTRLLRAGNLASVVAVDFSDIQEMSVKLIRRDGGLWNPQRALLNRIEWHVATGNLADAAYLLDQAWQMEQVLPKSARSRPDQSADAANDADGD